MLPEISVRQVRSAVKTFAVDAEHFDDLAMLCLEYCKS